ncbi:MAG: nucleotidyltransferase domain-containing protein [Candidatus Magasanikbacteria bacterium]|nr:nucleotidyltransferase domain-containing protein [Candidatus Magasanikbacteria bacterium]
MIKAKHLLEIKKRIADFNNGKKLKFFVFGSSLTRRQFGDFDLAVIGKVRSADLAKLKEEFANSNLPYSVDIVQFDKTSKEFQENVLKDKILWLTH